MVTKKDVFSLLMPSEGKRVCRIQQVINSLCDGATEEVCSELLSQRKREIQNCCKDIYN